MDVCHSDCMDVCHPDCYTKGRGCMISMDGRCLHIFAKQNGSNQEFILKNYIKHLDLAIVNKFGKNKKR